MLITSRLQRHIFASLALNHLIPCRDLRPLSQALLCFAPLLLIDCAAAEDARLDSLRWMFRLSEDGDREEAVSVNVTQNATLLESTAAPVMVK